VGFAAKLYAAVIATNHRLPLAARYATGTRWLQIRRPTTSSWTLAVLEYSAMATTPEGPTIRDLLRVLGRHKKKSLAASAMIVAGAALAILAMPTKYRSDAKLFVRVGRETVGLDPTAVTGQTLEIRTSREEEVNSVLAMLKTRSLAEKVVDSIGPEPILANPGQSALVTDLEARLTWLKLESKRALQAILPMNAAQPSQNAHPRQEAVTWVVENTEFAVPKLSTVIDLSCTAGSPKLAQQILNKLIETYLTEHARLNRTAGSEDFFREQTVTIGAQLAKKKHELRDLKNQLGVESIASQRALLANKKSAVEQQKLQTDGETAASLARTNALKQAIASLDEEVVTNRVSGRPNAAADGLRQKLYDLEIRERELLEKYADNHPFVISVRQQVAKLREIYSSENDSRSELTYALNDNRRRLELELMVEEARLAGLKATEDSLETQRSELLAELQQVNSYAIQIEDLERQTAVLEDEYRTHAHNLELARIDNELLRQGITNVNIVQSATLPELPAGPSKSALAGGGLLFAMLGGIVIALTAEHFDERIRSPREAEEVTSLPVLISVPFSTRHKVRT
jgi:uncharacterized protein involved in exopolysaccharide biosynthesis